jgi:N6-adenosine-specific RNA methylase IME4
MKIRIADIVVAERARKDLGDLSALADSIADVGLLHPPVVTKGLQLVAGERRLEAMKTLGLTETEVTVASNLSEALDAARAERDENTCRKALTPEEAVGTTERPWTLESEAAEAREKSGTAPNPVETFPRVDAGRTRDKVAETVDMSGRTLEKARTVVQAAREDPETFAPLVEQMNRTGKVDPAYRKVRAKQDEAEIIATPVISGKYRTIVIDPPWDHEGLSIAGRGAPEYAVMSHDELLALPVGEWAEEDCHLYLWTTNNFLTRAVELVQTWGFSYKTVLTWVKPRIGLGSYFRSSTEQVLFAVRGSMMTRARDIATHFEAPTGEHSEKPQEFFRLVERASYGPYLEAFARKRRDGWEVWGNVSSE